MTEQQIPKGWQMVKFGNIAKHISKRVEPTKTDLEIYVGLEHLDPDSLKIKRHGVPSDVEGQKLLVKKGQIIFGKRRAYQRKVAVADWDCICSAHAMVLEANPENIIPEFLPFFMQSDTFMNRAVEISEGSLSPTIKWKVLSQQRFVIPSINLQINFLNTLTKIEQVIKSASDTEDSALRFFQRLVDKFTTFDREDNLPTGYNRVRLKDISYINSKLLSHKTPRNQMIQYIDISSVSFPGFVDRPKKYLFIDAPSRARRIIQEGDVVVSTVRPNHKATFLVSESLKNSIVSTGFSVLRIEKNFSQLVYYFTLSKQFSHSLTHLAVGTSFPAVTDGDVLSQKIVIPRENELKKYIDALFLAEHNYRNTKLTFLKISQLKSNYLNVLFRGQ